MSSSYSQSSRSSPGSSRLHQHQQLGFVVRSASRLRSSSLKKPPEPLRRAVADCLSSSSSSSSSFSSVSSSSAVAASASSAASHYGSPAVVASEASRTLRDYLASSMTMDLAYRVILEHTIAERERSPAVVAKCIALLKLYLLRYKPSEETLLQIDRFCLSIIVDCDTSPSRRSSPWSQSLSQQSVASTISMNSSSFPVSSFASWSLIKSLNYVRSLVAQHIPRRLSQSAAFSGAPSASRQSLLSLSSLLRRSFNTQLSHANVAESSKNIDASALPVSSLPSMEKMDATEDLDYIAVDILKRRWLGEHWLSFLSTESGPALDLQEVNFIKLGAAALLVGDMEAKLKGQPWKYFGTNDMPYLDQLLLPSSVTTITDSTSASPHLRAITASKRSKKEPRLIWEDSPVSTFRPRAKPLFQYRHYSGQQPLRLNPAEVYEVIAAVSSEIYTPSVNQLTISFRLSHNSGKPSMDVAVSVLIKLVIDMYVLDSGSAGPLTLSMLEEMLSSKKAACRVRAFDLILNLGVHAHLLEPTMTDDSSTLEDESSEETTFESEDHVTELKRKIDPTKLGASSAIDNFESWILKILFDILLLLVQREETEESVWASALSCLLYFVCDRGKILRNRLNGLDIRVIKALIETSRWNSWAELVHSKLICMLTNLFYEVHDESTMAVSKKPSLFLIGQVDLIGGIEFIFYEYSIASLREERRNLYVVLFDYVLHQINEACLAAGVSEYGDDEVQPLATLFTLADAPEAFYISVKLGLEGIGELLRRSISVSLSTYSSYEQLNTLLENLTEKFDALITSFTHVDKEFSHLIQITESYKYLESIDSAVLRNGILIKAKVAWASLHSLLHSETFACRRNGYIWLGDLLIAEISQGRDATIWSNVKVLRDKIAYAGAHDPSVASGIPLSIWLMCGLLKSKHNLIRCGFLIVLERLLMQCKFLLDENDMKHSISSNASHENANSPLEKANAVIDIMSSALSLVAQINETDRINILKMCDILFSQLCLKVPSGAAIPRVESMRHNFIHAGKAQTKRTEFGDVFCQQENKNDFPEETDSSSNSRFLKGETASMAAMLLQGLAVVPIQLVTRVPAVLFYWPLIQLAGAATDNIAMGVAVGSKGGGNLPGAATDIRATLLLLLIGKCTSDPSAFQEVGGEEFFRELLDDTDSRVAYYSSAFLLKRMMTENPDEYQHMLQNLVFKAQQSNNEKLLENPYLQMRGILQLSNDG